MTIKYNSELSGISKALESYINLAERLNTEQLVQVSKTVLSTQQLISKFNDLNVTGAIAGLKTISDKLQTINLSSTVDSINRNSATSVVQKIIEANKTIYNSFLEDYSENESEYVSNEVSQTANEMVSNLENLSKQLGTDTIEIPEKKEKWTKPNIIALIGIILPFICWVISYEQTERHHQETMTQQRLETQESIELEQDRIQSIDDLSVEINELTQAFTDIIDMSRDLINSKENTPKDNNDY